MSSSLCEEFFVAPDSSGWAKTHTTGYSGSYGRPAMRGLLDPSLSLTPAAYCPATQGVTRLKPRVLIPFKQDTNEKTR